MEIIALKFSAVLATQENWIMVPLFNEIIKKVCEGFLKSYYSKWNFGF